jgi:SAM-dependent methyltransferase
MYGENRLDDAIRCGKACLSNQLARFAPELYVKLTGETGRGRNEEQPDDIVNYFRRCFDDYFKKLDIASQDVPNFLSGKHLLEYGPGDVPGVALLMVAHGANRVTCVDRFPLVSFSDKNIKVLEELMAGLEGDALERARACFNVPGEPASGLAPGRIEYRITPSGLSGLSNEVDLIYSRAVLEHVNDLSATFQDMAQALRNNAIAIHQVDLKSHGLHRRNQLDFLTWPRLLWDLMYSQKGVPNRWRVDAYRQAVADTQFDIQLLEPTALADMEMIKEVRPYLAPVFSTTNDEDLAWLGFWLVVQKPDSA